MTNAWREELQTDSGKLGRSKAEKLSEGLKDKLFSKVNVGERAPQFFMPHC